MTFHVGEAIDFADPMENGPLVVFWGQTEYIPPAADVKQSWPDAPPALSRRERRKGYRPFKVLMRLQPPDGEDLTEWGGRISDAMGVSMDLSGPRNPDHKAIFAPGVGNYRNAAEALAGSAGLLRRLQGFEVSGLQVKVEGWDS